MLRCSICVVICSLLRVSAIAQASYPARAYVPITHYAWVADSPNLTGCGQIPQIVEGSFDLSVADQIPLPYLAHGMAAVILRQNGVGLTRPALIAALQSDKSNVRALASWRLADLHAQNAVSGIIKAGSVEKDTLARVYLECALVELGDKRGVPSLRKECDDSTVPIALRLYLADALLELRQQSCPKVVVEGFTTADRTVVEQTMDHFYYSSPQQYAELRSLLLESDNPYVRRFGVEEMVTLGDVAAIPQITSMIEMESDKFNHEVMAKDLKRLIGEQFSSATK
jgi:hypothetical protein